MSMTTLIAGAFALMLAYANGANDNSKGVATLIGGGVLARRPAIFFAAVTTLLGSIASVLLAGVLLKAFSGKDIVDAATVEASTFPVAVGLGAALTVLLATRIAMPISTTHALVGSIIGVGVAAGGLHWSGVFSSFFIPLLVSPFIALIGAWLLYQIFRTVRLRLGVTSQTCLCAGSEPVPLTIHNDGSMSVAATGLHISTDDKAHCREKYFGRVIGIDAQKAVDYSHMFTAGSVSFARGLNDTPKIAALMVAAGALGSGGKPQVALITVGIAMAAGGLLAVWRVSRTMSDRITGMNDGQAFTANLVTALLVIVASRLGMPVSTTHVSCGSLFGIGAANGRAHWKVIGTIVLAWITTLPVAALIAFGTWKLFSS